MTTSVRDCKKGPEYGALSGSGAIFGYKITKYLVNTRDRGGKILINSEKFCNFAERMEVKVRESEENEF